MAYLALYRKYRPQTFDKVVGQEHITKTLINQIKSNKISHAYLFCGSRGTGKTSVAKIFARAINCETPIDGSPCGKCKSCQEVNVLNNMDIMEIDAASNNRVDEIRDLREKVKYPPVTGKYKVYIVDEVHMLTDSAFNALLKTLEEPPAHCVFILATTEVQKLPATILSRCMRFDFKLIEQGMLEQMLKSVFDDSGIKYDNDAVAYIAKEGNGSARDTLSIADMCVSFSNSNVTYDSVLQVLGVNDDAVLGELAQAIIDGDAGAYLSKIDELAKLGKSLSMLVRDISIYFRNLMIVKSCKGYRNMIVLRDDVARLMEKQATALEMSQITDCLAEFGEVELNLKYSVRPQLLIEVAGLKCMKKKQMMKI